MKKNSILHNLILLITFLLFLSCNNDLHSDESIQNIETLNLQSRDGQIYEDHEIFNTENFDFFGKEHNNALDYALSQIDAKENLAYNNIEIHTNHYFDYIYEPTSQFRNDVKDKSYKYIYEENKNNPNLSLVASFRLKNGIAYPQIESYLSSLDEVLNSSLPFEEKVNLIRSLDSNISRDTNLIDEDKTFLLLTNSVARNSVAYWNTSLSDGWRDLIDVQIGNNPEVSVETYDINWSFVAKADIVGFIREFGRGALTGAIRGAIIGALSSGGTGAIPGAIIGALGWGAASGARGAAIASGAAAVASFLID